MNQLIKSLWTITFDAAAVTGSQVVLLSTSDWLVREPEPSADQGQRAYAPLGLTWGRTEAAGGVLVTLEWTKVLLAQGNSAGRLAALDLIRQAPWNRTANVTLVVAGTGGGTRYLRHAHLAACVPLPYISASRANTDLQVVYRIRGGELVTSL